MSAEVPQRTWDDLEIAADRPMGATVVVRRPGPDGIEVLLLHRAINGVEFAGDWAWTAPAGCRQPGEAVYPAALRELAEEAGLVGQPWAVDLSGQWAVFALDVPAGTDALLVDPEHDRHEWCSVTAAHPRVLPRFVADQQRAAAGVPVVTLRFRRMTTADLDAVAQWLTAPHARPWWTDEATVDALRAKYEPRIRGEEPIRMWIVEVDDRPVGFLQDYPADVDGAYAVPAAGARPKAVGFDYLIGEASYVGKSLGTRMIWEFCRDVMHPAYPGVERFVASPRRGNHASLRVLAKSGFTVGHVVWPSGPAPEADQVVHTLDVRHWLGARRPPP